MNAEDTVKLALQKDGWTVHRNGWPDFLCVKVDYPKGWKRVRFLCVEAKLNALDKPSKAQLIIHKLLRQMGIHVYVMTPDMIKDFRKRGQFFVLPDDKKDLIKEVEQLQRQIFQNNRDVELLRKQIEAHTILLKDVDINLLETSTEIKEQIK